MKEIIIRMDDSGEVSGSFDPALTTPEIVWMMRVANENVTRIIHEGFKIEEVERNDSEVPMSASSAGQDSRPGESGDESNERPDEG